MENPLIAVWMVTYNHEKYISQAIEGFLLQTTNFPIKLFIGEDCSTDGTRQICLKYEKQFPQKIEVICTSENNIVTNTRNIYAACFSSGAKYIAMCEGDDYWNDPYKLQKQVDILENNNGFVACSCNVFERTGDDLTLLENKKDITSFSDLVNGNSLHTSSVLFRNIIQIPEWFSKCAMGDWIIWLLLTRNGSIYNIKEPMAVYRMHSNGIWIGRGKENNLKDMIAAYNILIEKFPPENKKELKVGAGLYYNQLLSLLSEKRSPEIFYWFYRSFKFDYNLERFKYLIKYFKIFFGP